MSCEKEIYDSSYKEGNSVDQFFNCSTRAPIVDGVINFLKVKNDSLDFIPKFVEKYGMPSWDNSVYLEEDNKYLLVPFKNSSKKEIEGIWTFKIDKNNYIHSFPVIKQKTSERDYWTFDYFTCDVLKKKPKSGLVFEDVVKTKAGFPDYKCIRSRVEVEFNGRIGYGDWKTHCWSDTENFSMFGDDSNSMMSDIPLDDGGGGGDYMGGGGGDYMVGGGTTDQPENKNKDKLPIKKPTTAVDDCDGNYENIKGANNSLLNTIKRIQSIQIGDHLKPSFNEFLNMVKIDPAHEHSMSFQNYGEDGFVAEPINTGSESSVLVNSTINTGADIHNHPNNTPPSPRDLWGLVSNVNDSNLFNTRFVIGNNGDYYAMNVTDPNKVKAFYNQYGSIDDNIDSSNNFKKGEFKKDWKNAMDKFKKLRENDAWCYTLAYIMQKYDMGITILSQKKDENGFTSMHMKQEVDPKDSKANYLIPAKCK